MNKNVIIYPIDLYDVNTTEFMRSPFVTVNNKQSAEAVVAKATSLSNERAEIEFIDTNYLGNGWNLHPVVEQRSYGKVLIGLSFLQSFHHE